MFLNKDIPINDPNFRFVELQDKKRRKMTIQERQNPNILPQNARIFRYDNITSPGRSNYDDVFEFEGEIFRPGPNLHWKTNIEGMKRLADSGRIAKVGKKLAQIRFLMIFLWLK